ncbi:MAG: hypothetical protein HQL93_13430, partial [Magnetococcales bacterium]|nr:hypothetical protein [Magnetococcales bacterium]
KDRTLITRNANTIGMEAEICEECGGNGHLFVLDERDQFDPCPWCYGTGRITEQMGYDD